MHKQPVINATLSKQSSSNSVCMWGGSLLFSLLSPETKVRAEVCVVTPAIHSISSKTNIPASAQPEMLKTAKATCLGYSVAPRAANADTLMTYLDILMLRLNTCSNLA